MTDNFLYPIIKELRELEIGQEFNQVWYRFFLLFMVADKPARAMILNMKLSSSYYGCLKCEIEGESVAFGNGQHIIFKSNDNNMRNRENYFHNLNLAISKNKPVKGVKGKCLLSILKYFHPISSSMIDFMHSIFLGVCKLLFYYWFTAPTTNSYSLKSKLNELNVKLLAMKPPNFVAQAPRKLEEYTKWRAHEFMNFFLFFAVPLFKDIMSEDYYKHILLLIIPLENLLCKKILRINLDLVESMLKEFVVDSVDFYDTHFY